jgi:hypothetical protein
MQEVKPSNRLNAVTHEGLVEALKQGKGVTVEITFGKNAGKRGTIAADQYEFRNASVRFGSENPEGFYLTQKEMLTITLEDGTKYRVKQGGDVHFWLKYFN